MKIKELVGGKYQRITGADGKEYLSEHIHKWGEEKESESGEKIKWCKGCEATIDSDGGIIK